MTICTLPAPVVRNCDPVGVEGNKPAFSVNLELCFQANIFPLMTNVTNALLWAA